MDTSLHQWMTSWWIIISRRIETLQTHTSICFLIAELSLAQTCIHRWDSLKCIWRRIWVSGILNKCLPHSVDYKVMQLIPRCVSCGWPDLSVPDGFELGTSSGAHDLRWIYSVDTYWDVGEFRHKWVSGLIELRSDKVKIGSHWSLLSWHTPPLITGALPVKL